MKTSERNDEFRRSAHTWQMPPNTWGVLKDLDDKWWSSYLPFVLSRFDSFHPDDQTHDSGVFAIVVDQITHTFSFKVDIEDAHRPLNIETPAIGVPSETLTLFRENAEKRLWQVDSLYKQTFWAGQYL